MTIDSRWLQKDFKQKYYLFCREKQIKTEIMPIKFVKDETIHYLCPVIEIKSINEKM
jgi:hypothetical protein